MSAKGLVRRRGLQAMNRDLAVKHTGGVGYCRPPVEHRFKPGTSGNPRGRPRGSRNRSTLYRELARALECPIPDLAEALSVLQEMGL